MSKWAEIVVTDFTVMAPARLHFGLYSISGPERFGGAGLMINRPDVVVHCRRSKTFSILGCQREWITKVIDRLVEHQYLPCEPSGLPIQIECKRFPPRHCGFGSGTQLAFAVGATIAHCLKLRLPNAAEMARLVGRGKRSAIGSHGFYQGGFIADSGVNLNNPFSPIEKRVEFPSEWPVVLIRPHEKSGLHGQHEQAAFDRLKGSEEQHRERLKKLCLNQMIPSAENLDYESFAQALFDFNYTSGEYFSDFQSGAYNSPQCARIVRAVRDFGIAAVGQSSWGPALFAIAPSTEAADALVAHLKGNDALALTESAASLKITQGNNVGMKILHHQNPIQQTSDALTG